MSLKEELRLDMTEAIRSGDKEKRDTLRLLMAAIKQVEVDEQVDLEDDDNAVLEVLAKQAKQRKESIEEYAAAGREDLVHEEKAQLLLIESYLPAQLSREEVEAAAKEAIAATGATGPKDTGQVMGLLMPQLKGKVDGRVVNEVVRDLLRA